MANSIPAIEHANDLKNSKRVAIFLFPNNDAGKTVTNPHHST